MVTPSNPGFVSLGFKLGKEKLFSYIDLFGFGEKTGIDLNKRLTGEYKNYTPLSYAIGKWNNWPCIEILLRYGADINLKDGWGDSPLDLLKTEEKEYYKLAKKAGYLNKAQEEIKTK